MDQDDARAINPLDTIATRTPAAPQAQGADMRIIRRILYHVDDGPDGDPSFLRFNVLAWCPLRPIQLDRLDPSTDFRDVPDATRADQAAGASVLMPHHFKGRRKRLPARQLIPLTPYGVAAMRAFAAEPKAWGHGGRQGATRQRRVTQ